MPFALSLPAPPQVVCESNVGVPTGESNVWAPTGAAASGSARSAKPAENNHWMENPFPGVLGVTHALFIVSSCYLNCQIQLQVLPAAARRHRTAPAVALTTQRCLIAHWRRLWSRLSA